MRHSATETRVDGSLEQRITGAAEALARCLEGMDGGRFASPLADGAWSPAQIAGHAAEFPRTFALQLAELAAHPGLLLGRPLDDEGRLEGVGQFQQLGPAEAARRVRACAREAITALATIPAAGWDVQGERLNVGPMTVREMAERYIAGHLKGHAAELAG